MSMNCTITFSGFVMPVLLGHQLALHLDHANASLGHGAWSLTEGPTRTWGLDLGHHRVRLVVDRVEGRRSTGWGLL